MNSDILKELYKNVVGSYPVEVIEMPASGSNRRYFRLKGQRSIIGVLGEIKEENEAFLYMDKHFVGKGLPVPKVLEASDDHMAYIQEDLGDTILFNFMEKGRKTRVFSEDEKQMLAKTIKALCKFQFVGAQDMDFSHCYPASAFDARSIFWDLNYFKYCFLKATGLEFNEGQLEDDFHKLCDVLLRSGNSTFMYRDFQSTFKVAARGLSSTMWHRSCGRPKPTSRKACERSSYKYISRN